MTTAVIGHAARAQERLHWWLTMWDTHCTGDFYDEIRGLVGDAVIGALPADHGDVGTDADIEIHVERLIDRVRALSVASDHGATITVKSVVIVAVQSLPAGSDIEDSAVAGMLVMGGWAPAWFAAHSGEFGNAVASVRRPWDAILTKIGVQ